MGCNDDITLRHMDQADTLNLIFVILIAMVYRNLVCTCTINYCVCGVV
jgi:hypothetical protein